MPSKIAAVAALALLLATQVGCRGPRPTRTFTDSTWEPCPERIDRGHWAEMAAVPARPDTSQSFWKDEHVLTLLTYEPPTGLRYDLCANRWDRISTRGAPARSGSRFWTGVTLVIVGDDTPGAAATAFLPGRGDWIPWGSLPPGRSATHVMARSQGPFRLLARDGKSMGDFGPVTVLWDLHEARAVPLGGEAPSPRASYASAWMGDRFVAWGGTAEPPRQPWVPAPPRPWLGDGAVLEHQGDAWAWRRVSTEGAPSPRVPGAFARSGSRLAVWGGLGPGADQGVSCPTDGAVYDALKDSWSPIPARDAPSPRLGAAAIATGKWFVVLGGSTACGRARDRLADGGVYDLEAGTWRALSLPGPVAQDSVEVAEIAGGRVAILPGSNGTVGSWLGILDPGTGEVIRVDIPQRLQGRRGMQVVFTQGRLLLFGGFRDIPRPPCPGPMPCDYAGPTTELTPDGLIYGF